MDQVMGCLGGFGLGLVVEGGFWEYKVDFWDTVFLLRDKSVGRGSGCGSGINWEMTPASMGWVEFSSSSSTL